MANIDVIDSKIVRLQSCAQGFRTAFYVIYNSFMSKEGCESWMQDGDGMSVLGTNGCFSVELYLKFLMVIDSFDPNTLTGNHVKGHALDDLFKELDKRNHTMVSEIKTEFSNRRYSNGTLIEFLTKIRDYFVDWRYSYDFGALNINLNTLSDLLNVLEKYSIKKFLPVSEVLAANGTATDDNQSMSISNFDDIKKD